MSKLNWQHRTLGAVRDVPPELLVHLAALSIAKRYNYWYWRDEMIDLSGVNPVGPATAPTADPDGEGFLFDGGTTDSVAVLGRQINHDCAQGLEVPIVPHLHWRKTTNASGAVLWKLDYKLAAPGGDFADYTEWGTASAPIDATVDNNTAARHLISSFGMKLIPVSLSTKIYFKLTRQASVTSTDTYAADALAMSFDYHYPADSPGSYEEYRKGDPP